MRKSRSLTTAAALLTAALTLTACGDTGDDAGKGGSGDQAATIEGAEQNKGGVTLDTPFEKPDLTLTDDEGETFDLIEETEGHPTLLFFGYTHCPDVCPLTMSNLAIAESRLTEEQQKKLRVVFVTTDPKRDTPERLDTWLGMHDKSFIGLTGDFDTIQAGARSVGIHVEESYEKKNGDIVSTHGAQVLAFSPEDDKAHLLYTDGSATPEILKKELPKIIKGEPL
jgi:protein SCO1